MKNIFKRSLTMKTNKRTSGLVSLMALAMCFALAGSAHADITVGNAAFEDVPVGSGGYTYTYTPWYSDNEGGGPPAWISNGYYGDEPLPVNPAMVSTSDRVYQDLTDTDPSATYATGNTYIFSMDIGGRPGANDWELFFYDATAGDAATPLKLVTGSIPAGTEGNYQTFSMEYTATATEAGHNIGIGFRGVDYYVYFDNAAVSLSGGPTLTYPVSEENVAWNAVLTWDPPSTYTPSGYNVYVDTDPNVPGVPAQVEYYSLNQPGLSFDPPGDMAHGVTYYWRVEAIQTPVTTPPSDPNFVSSSIAWFSTVPDLPTITGQPQDQTVAAGDPATFTVVSPNATDYQWKKYVDGLDDPNVGDNSDTLAISNVQEINEGFYYCVVSNLSGTLASSQARLWTERLIGYWPMDNNADDAVVDVDGPIDGTVFGDPTWVAGITNQAINLEAHPTDPNKNDYVVLGDADDLNFRTSTDFTVSLWIKASSLDDEAAIISNKDWNSGSNTGWLISGSGNGQTWQWNYKGATGGRADYDPSGPILTNNEWRHLCVTHDRNGYATFYVDGEAQGQVNIAGSIGTLDPGLPTVIGTDGILGANWGAWLTAAIDEVKIYSYVLDPVEVALLYTTPSGKEACVELPEFDLNDDCEVNLVDIWLFQSKWLECYIVPTCIP
jgi:hypothetical protein